MPLLSESPCPSCSAERYERFKLGHESIKNRNEAFRVLEGKSIRDCIFSDLPWHFPESALASALVPHPKHVGLAEKIKAFFPELNGWSVSSIVPAYAEYLRTYKNALISEYGINRDPAFLGYLDFIAVSEAAPSVGEIHEHVYALFLKHKDNLKAIAAPNEQEIQKRYRNIVETMNEGIVESDHNGCLTYLNPNLCNMIGYPLHEALGRSMLEFFPPDEAELVKQRLKQRRMGVVDRYESLLKRKDGTLLPVLISANPQMGPAGEHIGTYALVADVRALKKLRDDLEHQKSELAHANIILEELRAEATQKLNTRSQFFQEASHDFKQRLHAIQLLVQTAKLGKPTETVNDFQKVADAIVNMKNFVTDFLEFTQLEVSALQPTLTKVGLQQLFQNLELEFEDIASERSVELHIRSTEIELITDKQLMYRMLENLVANAIKFSRGRVLVGARKSANGLIIEIWDNGMGIPLEKQNLVFDAFYKENPQNDYHEGVGLGLSIVKRLATFLGYSVHIHSVVGKSCVFKIYIPPSAEF
ncbi:MAG: PAS domain-containing sensor histidine kinase [Burkholderiaceae bacterium]